MEAFHEARLAAALFAARRDGPADGSPRRADVGGGRQRVHRPPTRIQRRRHCADNGRQSRERLGSYRFSDARVDVFDANFNLVTINGAFVDSDLPSGYAPFGVQTIGSRVFVTYAKQDAEATDEVHGQGRGLVDAYDTSGTLLARVAQHG